MNTTELALKIVIDTRDGRQELRMTEEDLVKLVKQTDALKDKFNAPFTQLSPTLKQFRGELLEVNEASELSSSSVADYIKYCGLLEKDIQQLIATLKTEQAAFAMGSSEYNEHARAILNLENGYKQLQTQQHQFPQDSQRIQSGANSMNMAIGQLGYALGDSTMFLFSFRTGLMSIANNIPMIIQYFQYAQKEADALHQTIGQSLVNSLKGPGGLLLAVNGVMLAMQVIPALFSDASKAIEETGNKAEETAKKIMDLGSQIAMFKFSSIEEARKGLDEYNKKANESIDETQKKLEEAIEKEKNLRTRTVIVRGEANVYDNTESQTYKEVAKSVKELQAELEKLKKTKQDYNEYVTVTTDKLTKFKVTMADSNLSVKDLKDMIQSFTPNELSALSGTMNELNGYLIINGEKSKVASGNIAKLNTVLSEMKNQFKVTDPSYNALGTEAQKAAELKGELDKILIQKKEYLTQSQRELELAEVNYDSKIQGLKDELSKLQQDPKKSPSDLAKMKNIETEIAVNEAKKEYEIEQLKKKVLMETFDQKVKQYEIDTKLAELHGQTSTYVTAQLIDELEVMKSQAKTSEERLKIELKLKEVKAGQFTMGEKGTPFGFQGGKSPLDYISEEEQLTQALWNEKEKRYNILNEMVSNFSSAYNSIYSILQSNAKDEITQWEDKESKKIEEEHKAALKHARTQADRERIDRQYQSKKDKLEEDADKRAKEKLGAWFTLQKAMSIAQATINTYEGADKALAQGGVLGPILAAAVIAAGLANVALISQQKMPGFEKGGIVVGEKGPEVIAPMQDYARGWANLASLTSALTVQTIKQKLEYIKPQAEGSSNPELLNEIKKLNENFNRYASRPSIAVIEKKEFRKGYLDSDNYYRNQQG